MSRIPVGSFVRILVKNKEGYYRTGQVTGYTSLNRPVVTLDIPELDGTTTVTIFGKSPLEIIPDSERILTRPPQVSIDRALEDDKTISSADPISSKSLYQVIQEHNDLKKPKHSGQAAVWKAEGLCPRCGEKGRFSHFAFVCSMHGEY